MTGLYKHYKGAFYRVLFTAEWIAGSRPETNDQLAIVMVDSTWLGVHKDYAPLSGMCFDLLKARWSGNTNAIAPGELVVIYVSLSTPGRISARALTEFSENVSVDGRMLPRFERVAE